MGISLKEKIKQLPEAQQKEISLRTSELIAEENKREQIRKIIEITKEQTGKFLVTKLNTEPRRCGYYSTVARQSSYRLIYVLNQSQSNDEENIFCNLIASYTVEK